VVIISTTVTPFDDVVDQVSGLKATLGIAVGTQWVGLNEGITATTPGGLSVEHVELVAELAASLGRPSDL